MLFISAGIGRTGVLITIELGFALFKEDLVRLEPIAPND